VGCAGFGNGDCLFEGAEAVMDILAGVFVLVVLGAAACGTLAWCMDWRL
jgi:hypothetical protein